jgi:3-dehydroquinate dehydratase-1
MMNLKLGNLTLGAHPLIVVPLTDGDVESLDSLEGADAAELRLDMFLNPADAEGARKIIALAAEKFRVPLIATFRRKEEGGAADVTEDTRLSMLEAAAGMNDVAALDVEIHSPIAAQVMRFAGRSAKLSIASYHNFKETPPIMFLDTTSVRGWAMNADVIKIAVMPRTAEDLRTLTKFTLRHYRRGIVTIAMGSLGASSRLYLPLIGSLMTFASIKTQSAPGQLTVAEVRRFLARA